MSTADVSMMSEDRRPWWRQMNAEPVVFFVMFSQQLSNSVQPLLLFYARCNEMLRHRQDITHLHQYCAIGVYQSNDTSDRDAVEMDFNKWNSISTISTTLPIVFVAPVLNSLSDLRLGRKLLLAVVVASSVVESCTNLYITFFYSYVDSIWMVLTVSKTITSFSGGTPIYINMIMCMIIDDAMHTNMQHKMPLRFSIVMAISTVAALLSVLAVSTVQHIFGPTNYYGPVALLQFTFILVALVYVLFMVRETHIPSPEPQSQTTGGCRCIWVEAAAKEVVKRYWNAIEVLIAKRPGWHRFCLVASILFCVAEYLERYPTVLTMRLKLAPFGYGDETITTLGIFSQFGNLLGLFALPPLVEWLGFGRTKVTVIVLLSIVGHIVAQTVFGLAQVDWLIYGARFLNSFIPASYLPALSAFLVGFILENETGRTLGVIALFESIAPMIQATVFNGIFSATFRWFPGFIFLFTAAVYCLIFVGQSFVHGVYWRQKNREEQYERLLSHVQL